MSIAYLQDISIGMNQGWSDFKVCVVIYDASRMSLAGGEVKPILSKVKHPQTNGKLERWFGEYQRLRLAFSSSEVFRDWYNNRPHGCLNFEHLETPEKAFWRKMRLEMYFAK